MDRRTSRPKTGHNNNSLEARRLAAARVKAHLKKEKTLPGYHRNRRGRRQTTKPKKEKSIQRNEQEGGPSSLRPPWNDRFYAEENDDREVNLDRGATSRSRRSYRPLNDDIHQTGVARYENIHSPSNQEESQMKSLTERKDGSPIITTIIYRKCNKPTSTRTRAVSPFDIKRINDILHTDQNSKRIRKQKLSSRSEKSKTKEDVVITMQKRTTDMADILNYWQNIKAYSKLSYSQLLPGSRGCGSMDALVKFISESILNDLIFDIADEMEEVLTELSNGIVDRL